MERLSPPTLASPDAIPLTPRFGHGRVKEGTFEAFAAMIGRHAAVDSKWRQMLGSPSLSSCWHAQQGGLHGAHTAMQEIAVNFVLSI
jgi:hypothetical protein